MKKKASLPFGSVCFCPCDLWVTSEEQINASLREPSQAFRFAKWMNPSLFAASVENNSNQIGRMATIWPQCVLTLRGKTKLYLITWPRAFCFPCHAELILLDFGGQKTAMQWQETGLYCPGEGIKLTLMVLSSGCVCVCVCETSDPTAYKKLLVITQQHIH